MSLLRKIVLIGIVVVSILIILFDFFLIRFDSNMFVSRMVSMNNIVCVVCVRKYLLVDDLFVVGLMMVKLMLSLGGFILMWVSCLFVSVCFMIRCIIGVRVLICLCGLVIFGVVG